MKRQINSAEQIANLLLAVTNDSSRRRVVDCDGRVTHVCVRALHCEQCGTFVRSEDVECPDGRSGSA